MALSNDTARDSLTASQVLLQIASAIKSLNADPKRLATLAKEAYALPEAEMLKADEARLKIDEYKALVKKQSDTQAQIDDDFETLENQRDEIANSSKKLDERKGALDILQAELNKKARDLADKEKQLMDALKTLEAKEAKLVSDRDKLAAEKKANDELTASLKAKANQFKGLTEGL